MLHYFSSREALVEKLIEERFIEAHAGALSAGTFKARLGFALLGARRDVPGIIVDRRFACRLMWILHHA